MPTVLEIIAPGLSSVLVLKLGCLLELLGFFKQCAQATSYSYYLRLSERAISKTPQLIAVWNRILDAMIEYFTLRAT